MDRFQNCLRYSLGCFWSRSGLAIFSNKTTTRNKEQGSYLVWHLIYTVKQYAALFFIPYYRPIWVHCLDLKLTMTHFLCHSWKGKWCWSSFISHISRPKWLWKGFNSYRTHLVKNKVQHPFPHAWNLQCNVTFVLVKTSWPMVYAQHHERIKQWYKCLINGFWVTTKQLGILSYR